jgi:hypothetical protein
MGHELGAAVGNDGFGRAFIPEDSVDIEPNYIFRSNYLVAGERDGLLIKTVYHDENHIITFLAWGHGLEIHSNVLPRTVRNG